MYWRISLATLSPWRVLPLAQCLFEANCLIICSPHRLISSLVGLVLELHSPLSSVRTYQSYLSVFNVVKTRSQAMGRAAYEIWENYG